MSLTDQMFLRRNLKKKFNNSKLSPLEIGYDFSFEQLGIRYKQWRLSNLVEIGAEGLEKKWKCEKLTTTMTTTTTIDNDWLQKLGLVFGSNKQNRVSS